MQKKVSGNNSTKGWRRGEWNDIVAYIKIYKYAFYFMLYYSNPK